VAGWRRGRLPLQRSGDPDDAARAAVFLAANDFITGAALRVGGVVGRLGSFPGEGALGRAAYLILIF
jgi:NAD(P)-dependent dehydrogenase (short-subunit alcohol dehydrogenase family)